MSPRHSSQIVGQRLENTGQILLHWKKKIREEVSALGSVHVLDKCDSSSQL